MGSVMDNKRIGKKSKFKPWIKIGSFGLVVAGALVFLPIPNASLPVKIMVCVITYLLWDICYTIVNIPYGALNSSISGDSQERTSLSTFRSIGAGIGGFLCLLLPSFVYDSNENLIGERLIWICIILGVISFFAFQACIRMTTERYEVKQVNVKINYFKTLKGFLKNRPLIAMCLASFAMLVFFTSNLQTTKWLFQCYFGNASTALTIAGIVSYLPMIILIPFVGKIVKKFGKKLAAGLPLLFSIVVSVILLFIPMEENSTVSAMIYVIGLMLIQLGGGVFQLVCWALITDCIDYQQIQSGQREEGSVYAIYSLFRKIAQGVALYLPLYCMEKVGYLSYIKPISDQLPGVSEKMKTMAILLMLFGSVVMAISMLLIYNLGKKEVADIATTLGKDLEDIDINSALENRNE
jgi:GPH family glycoside/pentoside/hexuronide:cation symporter